MAKIARNITELMGKTSLLGLTNFEKKCDLKTTIFAKLEYSNPASSVKNRIAKATVDDVEQKGLLKTGSVIIEPTSGNTGIGLASVAATRDYWIILTMPEAMSIERRNLLKTYGAEVILTDDSKGMRDAITKATELAEEVPSAYIPRQFENPANPATHQATTGPGIQQDMDGKVDFFVASIRTGGTIMGVGEYLRSQNPDVKVTVVEPASSPVLSKGTPGPHQIRGIDAGFVPDVLNIEIYDKVIPIEGENAFAKGKEVARTEGLLVGASAGAALWVAEQLAKHPENAGKTIVTFLPDTGECHLSTPLFSG